MQSENLHRNIMDSNEQHGSLEVQLSPHNQEVASSILGSGNISLSECNVLLSAANSV